jgi:hypothetical protein
MSLLITKKYIPNDENVNEIQIKITLIIIIEIFSLEISTHKYEMCLKILKYYHIKRFK